MPERFQIYIVYKRRYIITLPFLSRLNIGTQTLRLGQRLNFKGCLYNAVEQKLR